MTFLCLAVAPLVGYPIVDARELVEAVEFVAGTPCAVAHGAIKVCPLVDTRG